MAPSLGELNPAGWFHLAYFGVILPVLAVYRRKQLLPTDQPLPNRLHFFQRTAFGLAVLATLSLLVAFVQRIALFPRSLPPIGAIIAGGALYAAAVTYMRPRWRRAVESRSRVVHLYMPANLHEIAWWVVVSILAGVGEEITWRGVQGSLVGIVTGNYWIAAVLCSASFGLTHIIQGWRSTTLIVVFALGFHTLVWLAGSLYVAMAAHVAYDITAGVSYGMLGRQLAPEGLDSREISEP